MNIRVPKNHLSLLFALLFGLSLHAQTDNNPETSEKPSTECSAAPGCNTSKDKATSGCSPSSCRGAKTKFGEAKVISELREKLIAIKAELERSSDPVMSKRSYDIHDIVGETDEESLLILIRELKIIEGELSEKTDYKVEEFDLPSNKARQVRYINDRMDALDKVFKKNQAG